MPWILRKKKKAAALLAFVFLFTPCWYVTFAIWLLLLLYLLKCRIASRWYSLNRKIASHSNMVLELLHNRQEVRKIHTIIIGDTCSAELVSTYKRGNVLLVQFPERSLEASYHIFMHLESVLEDNARVVVLHDNRSSSNRITVFDLPYLHFISIKELHMEGWQHKQAFPLLYEPIRSIKYLLGVEKKGYQETPCPLDKLVQFCIERNFDLKYLSINK